MKKLKSILILIISMLLIFGMYTFTYAETTTNNITLTTDSTNVNVGDNLTVTLKIAQKIQAADFTINYSSDILEFVSTSINEDHYNATNAGIIKVCTYSTSGIDTFTFTFKVKAAGNANVTTDIEGIYLDQNATNALTFENETVTLTSTEKPKITDVTSVTLDKTTASIKVEETLKLTATVLPTDATDKTVTWKSSDEKIATVSNGTVKGIKAGTATITATSGTKSATCTITVTEENPSNPDDDKNKTIDVTSITLNKTTASMKVGETLKLTATVFPTDATDKTVNWKSSDEKVATVSNGTVKALKAGNVTITATSGTKSVTCNIVITNDANNATDTNKDTNKDTNSKDTTVNKDNTTANTSIPQTGDTVTLAVAVIAIVVIATISIIKYRKYKDIM